MWINICIEIGHQNKTATKIKEKESVLSKKILELKSICFYSYYEIFAIFMLITYMKIRIIKRTNWLSIFRNQMILLFTYKMRKWAVERNCRHLRKQNSFGTSLKTKLTGSYIWKKRKMCSNIFSGWTRFKKKRGKLALIRYISASFLKSCYLSSEYLLLQNFSSSSFY